MCLNKYKSASNINWKTTFDNENSCQRKYKSTFTESLYFLEWLEQQEKE